MRQACCFVLLALLAAFAVSARATPLQPGQQIWRAEQMDPARQARIAALQGAMLARLEQGQGRAALDQLLNEPDPLVRDWSAHALLRVLAEQPRRSSAQALIEWAAQQPVRFVIRHDETAADWFLPLFDLPAEAAQLLRVWDQAEQRAVWRERLRNDPDAVWRSLPSLAPEAVQRATEALRELTPEALARAKQNPALSAKQRAAVPAGWWLALAERGPDAALLSQVLRSGDGEQRLRALALCQALTWAEARPLLEALEGDPQLGSAATLQLWPRLWREHADSTALLQRLADPARRASAAAALVALAEADGWSQFDPLWSQADTEARRGLALAAQMADSAPAKRRRGLWTEQQP